MTNRGKIISWRLHTFSSSQLPREAVISSSMKCWCNYKPCFSHKCRCLSNRFIVSVPAKVVSVHFPSFSTSPFRLIMPRSTHSIFNGGFYLDKWLDEIYEVLFASGWVQLTMPGLKRRHQFFPAVKGRGSQWGSIFPFLSYASRFEDDILLFSHSRCSDWPSRIGKDLLM